MRGCPARLHLDSVIGGGVGSDTPVNVEGLPFGLEIQILLTLVGLILLLYFPTQRLLCFQSVNFSSQLY